MIPAENIENLAQGKDHSENALLAAREIVKWLDALIEEESSGAESVEDIFRQYTSDGLALKIENIIAHQYSEEPRGDAIPFTD